MRVISQNSMIDVPYEACAFSIGENINGFNIYARSKFLDEKPCLYATYKSGKKALKAMEMLRDAFTGKFVFKNVDLDDSVFELLKEWKSKGVVVTTNDDTQDVQYINNAIFQFPQDEEIEV